MDRSALRDFLSGEAGSKSTIKRWIATVVSRHAERRRRRNNLNELLRMDNRQLSDIGFSRVDVQRIAHHSLLSDESLRSR